MWPAQVPSDEMAASSTSLNSQFSAGSSNDNRSVGQVIEPDDVGRPISPPLDLSDAEWKQTENLSSEEKSEEE